MNPYVADKAVRGERRAEAGNSWPLDASPFAKTKGSLRARELRPDSNIYSNHLHSRQHCMYCTAVGVFRRPTCVSQEVIQTRTGYKALALI